MNLRDIIPGNRENTSDAVRANGVNALVSSSRGVGLLDEVFSAFDRHFPALGALSPTSLGWPSVEVSETDKEIKVCAEVPGLSENDMEVLLEDGVILLRGEKRSETHDKDKQFSERFYGSFVRRIPLGAEIEEDKVDASFKNGVLTIVLPKAPRPDSEVKRITINS